MAQPRMSEKGQDLGMNDRMRCGGPPEVPTGYVRTADCERGKAILDRGLLPRE